MAERRYEYDEECERLAEHFLIDGPERADYSRDVYDLAQHIQDAVEMWFVGREPIKAPVEDNGDGVPIP